jgi:hypothetical protein
VFEVFLELGVISMEIIGIEGGLTLYTVAVNRSTCASSTSLGVDKSKGAFSRIGVYSGNCTGEEDVDEIVIGERADMFRMWIGIPWTPKHRLKAIRTNPSSHSLSSHVLTPSPPHMDTYRS